jgi:deaminated glutathione amidase
MGRPDGSDSELKRSSQPSFRYICCTFLTMNAIAAIQMTSGPDVAANLEQVQPLLEDAARRGAQLAVLPENFSFLGLRDADKREIAEADGSGPVQDFLAATASRLHMWIVAGTTPLRAGADGRVAAASLVYDAAGNRVARYDKIHLFDVDIPGRAERYRESAHVAPGSQVVVVDTPVGRVGLSVCYDVRFPELFRRLSAAGAQILTVPSAFTAPTGRAHWETLMCARAIENLCYVVAPAQSGFHPNGRETYGDSMIVDYWGRVVQRLPRGRGCIVAQVDAQRQAEVRQNFPALQHRVYAGE